MSKNINGLISGAARIFDLAGSSGKNSLARLREKRRQISSRSDAEAIYSDWCKIGRDIRSAMDKYESENEKRS